MKLFYSKGACSLAVRIAIHALNIKSEFIAVNLKTKEMENGEDYTKICPKGAVPAIQMNNGAILTENTAIQIYLAESVENSSALFPKKGIERYRVIEWLNFVSTELHKGCSPFFHPNMPDNVKQEIYRPALLKKLDYVNQTLNSHKYLTGEHFCLADGYLFVVLRWLPHLGFELKQWQNIERFFREVKTLPFVEQSLKEEQLT